MTLWDIDAEYDELMDELEEAVNARSPERGERIQVIRRRVDELIRAQVGCLPWQPDRRSEPSALN